MENYEAKANEAMTEKQKRMSEVREQARAVLTEKELKLLAESNLGIKKEFKSNSYSVEHGYFTATDTTDTTTVEGQLQEHQIKAEKVVIGGNDGRYDIEPHISYKIFIDGASLDHTEIDKPNFETKKQELFDLLTKLANAGDVSRQEKIGQEHEDTLNRKTKEQEGLEYAKQLQRAREQATDNARQISTDILKQVK